MKNPKNSSQGANKHGSMGYTQTLLRGPTPVNEGMSLQWKYEVNRAGIWYADSKQLNYLSDRPATNV